MPTITSWSDRIDIDALRSWIALYEVKSLIGESVTLCLSPIFAPSITPSIKKLIIQREIEHPINRWRPEDWAKLILVDVSDHHYLQHKASYNLDTIEEIYDHHFESVNFRKIKIWNKAHIESVGSCTTLIVQLAIDHNIIDQLSNESIIGLSLTAVSHTLNFQSSVTTDQDRKVYDILSHEMKKRWLWRDTMVSDYFNELEKHITSNITEAFTNDTKYTMKIDSIVCSITQCEVRDGQHFINEQKDIIEEWLIWLSNNSHAFVTIISIAEGKNYIFSQDPLIQTQLAHITNGIRNDNLLITDNVWMRKELVRELIKCNL